MEIPFSQRIHMPDNVFMRELDDESVILPLGREIYFGFADIGTRIWTALVSADSIQAAYGVLLSEFD